MSKFNIERGSKFEQLKPSKHTEKLHVIEVGNIRTHFEYGKNGKGRNYTYVYYKTPYGSYYPAANSTERQPLYLDGLVGCIKLTELNSQYRPIN